LSAFRHSQTSSGIGTGSFALAHTYP
jgi:hypothetical protein